MSHPPQLASHAHRQRYHGVGMKVVCLLPVVDLLPIPFLGILLVGLSFRLFTRQCMAPIRALGCKRTITSHLSCHQGLRSGVSDPAL